MLIGYARVSTFEQSLDLQTDALKKAGCDKIFTDKASGAKEDRPGLKEAMEYLREGDTLVVWKLDRLGRSLNHLIETINQLQQRQIGFKVIQESFDTTTPGGKLIFHVFGALAEFERGLIQERTKAGLTAARARGKFGGRPKKLSSKQIEIAKALHSDSNTSVADICKALNCSRATLYRYINREEMV